MPLFINKKTEMIWEVVDIDRINDLRKDADYEEVIQLALDVVEKSEESVKKSSKKA